MSKKILIGGGMALVALVVAVASMLLFAQVQPTEAEVRPAVEMALPDGAVVDQMTFAVFSDDRSKGRVSVKGTYSFSNDIYSLPTPPVELMRSLASAQIFDTDVARWWSENSSFYPQFKGKLGEFQKLYSKGEILEFSGELPFLAVVDGAKVDGSSLGYKPIEGTIEPEFGYAADASKVAELTAAVTEWRDRLKDEAAAAAAARAAAAEIAAAAAARAAEAEAAEAAKVAEAEAVAAAKAAAAVAAVEAEAKAAADEAARLATETTSKLPTSVRVPSCDSGMSEAVTLPVGWSVRAAWGGKHTKIEILLDGEWVQQQRINVTGQISAVRYCTTSSANAAIGQMPLTWSQL